MTRVGVNLLWLVPGAVGGSEEYVCRQLAALVEHDLASETPAFELTLFATRGFSAAHRELAQAAATVVAPIDGRSRLRRVGSERVWLPRAMRRASVDVQHHPGGTLPTNGRTPAVVTVHDVQYLTFPDTFSPAKLAWLRRSVPRAVHRASIVAVPSRYVADTIAERFGLDRDRIVVVPNAAPSRHDIAPAALAEVRARFQLHGDYVVYPAITYHHKNHATLLRAFAPLVHDDPERKLVLIGGTGPAEQDVLSLATELGLTSAVVRPGRVSDADRDALMRGAACLAFPSRYEGFGVPVLEAFVHGCPVIASTSAALPEAVGDAGIMLDALDVAAWTDALDRVLADHVLADDLRRRGARRAAEFSPAGSARALATAYGRALNLRPSS